MKKLGAVLLFLLVSGCASVEKNLAKDFVNAGSVKLNRCEITGFEYAGMNTDWQKSKMLKVLMVHGVGTHHPGYSRRIQENLSANIGLTVVSRLSKNIRLTDPADNKTPLGNLQITYWQNEDGSKNMLFYELTWSEITQPDKEIIAFDTTERYSEFRVPFNNDMKAFLDNVLPDPLVYVADKKHLILNSSKQALCWMLKTNWKDIPSEQSAVCRMSADEEIKDFDKENLLFITHSLGSQIVMDTLEGTADSIAEAEKTARMSASLSVAINNLKNREITVFMLANQLPILQIGHPLPKVTNRIDSYCYKGGKSYNNRIFKGVNIVAFSDPNDLLSYAIPQNFADKYLDSRICPRVTNVSVNVAPEISAFGFGIVNPVTAHTAYDNNPKVINLITSGTEEFYQNKELRENCRFIKMKKDGLFK